MNTQIRKIENRYVVRQIGRNRKHTHTHMDRQINRQLDIKKGIKIRRQTGKDRYAEKKRKEASKIQVGRNTDSVD